MGDDRPSRYVETLPSGRPLRVVYRASGLGGCERAFVAAARGIPGAPHPQLLLDVWDEGNRAEQQILDMWELAGGGPTHGQQDELELEVAETTATWNGRDYEVPVVLRAHVDGFGPTEASGRVLLRECKKFRPSTWPAFLSKGCEINILYPWQLAAMMFALHERDGDYPLVEMLGGRWDKDKPAGSEIVEVAVHYIDNPPIPLKAIKKKIARIERLLAEGYDPTDPEVKCSELYPCPWFKLHPVKVEASAEAVDVSEHFAAGTPAHDALTAEIVLSAQIGAEVKAIEAKKKERDAARRVIADALQELGVNEGGKAVAGGWIINRVHTVVAAHQVKESTRDYVSITMKKEG